MQSGAFVFLACADPNTPSGPSAPSASSASAPPRVPATSTSAHAPARVRVCTFRGHHGFPGLTVALEDSCGERTATCMVASPSETGAVDVVDVRVDLTAKTEATCAERGTRVTGTCELPATSHHEPNGRYPTGASLLAPRASIVVRANGERAGALHTDATGSPDPAEQCWTVLVR
jgi:hypothetical protein